MHFRISLSIIITSPPCALGLPGNSAQIHVYCASARSSSLAHELFMNTLVAVVVSHRCKCTNKFSFFILS